MRSIVTGGAGFIGSHLVDRLIAEGDDVMVIDNLSTGRTDRLPHETKLCTMSVTYRSFETLCDNFQPDVIYHLAAQVSVSSSVEDPVFDARENILGTITVLRAAEATGARVVFASSGGAVYDSSPYPRKSYPRIVGDPCVPISPYGLSKLAAEGYIRLASDQHTILRLANVYGPRQDTHGEGGVVACFAGTKYPIIYGDGEQTRDFVYVSDVVEAFFRSVIGGTWNIGTGRETSINELAQLFSIVSGSAKPRYKKGRPNEVRRSALEISQTKYAIGWIPKRGLVDGIRFTQEWVDAGEPVNGKC